MNVTVSLLKVLSIQATTKIFQYSLREKNHSCFYSLQRKSQLTSKGLCKVQQQIYIYLSEGCILTDMKNCNTLFSNKTVGIQKILKFPKQYSLITDNNLQGEKIQIEIMVEGCLTSLILT